MVKIALPADELEALVLARLREEPYCDDVDSVVVDSDPGDPSSWTVTHAGPRRDDVADIEAALRRILPFLKDSYDLQA